MCGEELGKRIKSAVLKIDFLFACLAGSLLFGLFEKCQSSGDSVAILVLPSKKKKKRRKWKEEGKK